MPVERSAGIIIFHHTPAGRRYLVIRSSRDRSQISEKKSTPEFWDFPKGVLEKGETGLEAARREAKEETGIENSKLIEGFKETVHYFTRKEGKPVPKFVAMFLGETKSEEVRLSWEHDKFAWLSFEEARERISLKPMKTALEKAEEFLKKHDRI